MTAKQALIEHITWMSEEDAAAALTSLERRGSADWDFAPAPPEVMAQFRKAIAELDAGRGISDESLAGGSGWIERGFDSPCCERDRVMLAFHGSHEIVG